MRLNNLPTSKVTIESNIENEDVKWGKLDEFIKKYQDPKEVDKLEKLKDELKEVEDICHKNLNDLLKRG
jgi:synaptobrevin family protein YKT6